jgi:hypothetical protein
VPLPLWKKLRYLARIVERLDHLRAEVVEIAGRGSSIFASRRTLPKRRAPSWQDMPTANQSRRKSGEHRVRVSINGTVARRAWLAGRVGRRDLVAAVRDRLAGLSRVLLQ